MSNIINVPLKVSLVGKTIANTEAVKDVYLSNGGQVRERDDQQGGNPVMELAGRGCYESYKRTSPSTDSHEGYLGNILDQAHGSVLEHSVISFYVEGISRADSHEVVRHRHFSFSQQSQRYVAARKPYRVAIHPTLLKHYSEHSILRWLEPEFIRAESVYENFRNLGLGKKEASEAARAMLPNAAETHMVITGNLRSWLEFVSKRDHEAADAGIRALAKEIYRILKEEVPEVFSEEAREKWDKDFAQGAARHDGQ